MKILRDPVYEYITLSDAEARLIDAPLFQRLRHVAQNGPNRLVYPSMLGTRFEHTLGVAHVASLIFDALWDSRPETVGKFMAAATADLEQCLGYRPSEVGSDEQVKPILREILRHAAFFHDVGHLPLSHSGETAFASVFSDIAWSPWLPALKWHELLGAELIRQRHAVKGRSANQVRKGALLVLLSAGSAAAGARWQRPAGETVSLSQSVFAALRSILVGEYDADRADYLLRDGYMSGAGFGSFDLQRFVGSMRLVYGSLDDPYRSEFRLMPTIKALSTIESHLIERYKLYKWVHFHHKVCLFDELVQLGAQPILSQRVVRQMLVSARQTIKPAEDDAGYYSALAESLTCFDNSLPPLLMFCPRTKWYELNTGFFFPEDSAYLDDSWFCQQLRKARFTHSQLVKSALVYREPVSISLWKEYSQFRNFMDRVHRLAPTELDIDGEAVHPDHIVEFLRKPWVTLREVLTEDEVLEWEGKFFPLFEDNLGRGLADVDPAVRPVVHWNDFYLIGDLRKITLEQRDGRAEPVKDCSQILDRLSGLADDIPYFVYFLASKTRIAFLKRDSDHSREEMERLQEAVARELVQTIASVAQGTVGVRPKRQLLDAIKSL